MDSTTITTVTTVTTTTTTTTTTTADAPEVVLGDQFLQWADEYLKPRIGDKIIKSEALAVLREYALKNNFKHLETMTSKMFKTKINLWAVLNGFNFEDRLMERVRVPGTQAEPCKMMECFVISEK